MRVRSVIAVLLFCSAAFVCAQGQQAILFLVRHADKTSAAANARLSALGKERARCLAQTLQPSKISAIYATDVVRTQETEAPLAAKTGITPIILPKADVAGLVARLRSTRGAALVVSHSDVLPALVARLGAGRVPEFGADEYDRLTIISIEAGRAEPAVSIRYCAELK